MENPEVAQLFEDVADLLEIQGANLFRVRAYRNAARTVRDLGEPLAVICKDAERKLHDLPGIGKDLADKILSCLASGGFPLLVELRGQVPAGLREMLRVPGVGPKKALLLCQKLSIDSPDKLRQACEQQRLREIKGFGAKSEENILKGLQNLVHISKRMFLAEAKVYADSLEGHLKKTPGIGQVTVAGSFRRRKETV